MKFKERSYSKRFEKHTDKIWANFNEIIEEAQRLDDLGVYEVSNVLIDSNIVFAVVPMIKEEGIEVTFKGHLEEKNQTAFALNWL